MINNAKDIYNVLLKMHEEVCREVDRLSSSYYTSEEKKKKYEYNRGKEQGLFNAIGLLDDENYLKIQAKRHAVELIGGIK